MTQSLRQRLAGGADEHRLLQTPDGSLSVAQARALGPAAGLSSQTIAVVSIRAVLPLVRVLIGLDGHVGGLLLVSASQDPAVVSSLAEVAGANLIISDRDDLLGALPPEAALDAAHVPDAPDTETRWMMTTSGTTGVPKIVPHTLDTLSRTVRRDPLGGAPVWGLVLEMTRFAGLQVALQSLIGGGTLAVAPSYASTGDQVAFLAGVGCTHLSATPTLWRRLLMAPGIGDLPLRQATMGGEIADQGILDAVTACYPRARVTHIYASTEAGVGFAVNDRRAGFPLRYLDEAPGGVGIAIRDGMLWLRPPGGRQIRYLGGQEVTLDDDGYVLTGDLIEIRDDRALFLGRDSGVVNVGGVKVYPERVERVIASVPGVGLVAISAKKNPITGALLVATVIPTDPAADQADLKSRILASCRDTLEREAVPARILFAEKLDLNAAGKIVRT